MLEGYERMEHVNVTNNTLMYEDEMFIPDVIIMMDCSIEGDVISCHGQDYKVTEIIEENIALLEQM